MRGIILQHWAGPESRITELSSANISKYAEDIGAEYRFITGNPFRRLLMPNAQKLYMLDEEFDVYDMVVMLDSDMFTRKGMNENIFTDVEGVGRNTIRQLRRIKNLKTKREELRCLVDERYPIWQGGVYRLTREIRQRLRKHINEDDLQAIAAEKQTGADEVAMHRMAVLAKLGPKESYYFPDYKWNCSATRPLFHLRKAALIHLRNPNILLFGKALERQKMKLYRKLVLQGIIEE